MTERTIALPPKIRKQVGAYTRLTLQRGPYETDENRNDMTTLMQMGLVVEGRYPNVNEVKRYDAGSDTWESIPVCSRTVRMGKNDITIFEPVTESPSATAR